MENAEALTTDPKTNGVSSMKVEEFFIVLRRLLFVPSLILHSFSLSF
jgi:hypothetical protein